MSELHERVDGLSRRSLLNRSAAALGIAVAGQIEGLFGDGVTQAAAHGRPPGYGPLIADPAGLLSLPDGFKYSIVAQSGVTTLESGEPTPSDPTGPRRSAPATMAGGRTPWNTWLTCEETEAILGKRHGYVFEVDPYDQRATATRGRSRHWGATRTSRSWSTRAPGGCI